MLITNTINDEILAEAKLSYMDRDNFKKMFDALQEGIIVLHGNAITMMNDLSNRVLSEVTGYANFFESKEKDFIDKKMFFLFQNAGSGTKIKKEKKKKKGTSSDFSKHSSGSENVKLEYSLRDFQVMSTKDLTTKVFTFDKEVSLKNDVTKTDGYKNIHAVIKNL